MAFIPSLWQVKTIASSFHPWSKDTGFLAFFKVAIAPLYIIENLKRKGESPLHNLVIITLLYNYFGYMEVFKKCTQF